MSQVQTRKRQTQYAHTASTGYSQQYLAKVCAATSTQADAATAPRKWDYLISDTVTFSTGHTYGIRIQKPAKADVFQYCVKIIAQQQVQTLYIENHEFSDIEVFNLTMLCKNKQVNLVNLTKQRESNVIQGPW
jgi:hypothetical protein